MQKFFKWLGIVLVAISVLLSGIYIYLSHAYRMHAAVLDGDYEEVTRLVKEEKVNPDKTLLSATPINMVLSSQNPDLKMLQLLLDLGANPNYAGKYGTRYLHIAVFLKRLDVVKILVQSGAEVDKTDEKRFITPLFVAAMFDQPEIVMYLLEQGADVNYKNKFGMTPLFSVSSEHNPEIFKLLIDHGADYNYYKNNWDRLRKQYPEQFGIN